MVALLRQSPKDVIYLLILSSFLTKTTVCNSCLSYFQLRLLWASEWASGLGSKLSQSTTVWIAADSHENRLKWRSAVASLSELTLVLWETNYPKAQSNKSGVGTPCGVAWQLVFKEVQDVKMTQTFTYNKYKAGEHFCFIIHLLVL